MKSYDPNSPNILRYHIYMGRNFLNTKVKTKNRYEEEKIERMSQKQIQENTKIKSWNHIRNISYNWQQGGDNRLHKPLFNPKGNRGGRRVEEGWGRHRYSRSTLAATRPAITWSHGPWRLRTGSEEFCVSLAHTVRLKLAPAHTEFLLEKWLTSDNQNGESIYKVDIPKNKTNNNKIDAWLILTQC